MLIENMGTILTALVLLGVVAAVILKIRRDRKRAGSAGVCAGCSCNSSCDGCGTLCDLSDDGR